MVTRLKLIVVDGQDVEVGLGSRAKLARGYVNATRRHVSGDPWYVRGPNPESPERTIRLPAAVTCKCGTDFRIAGDEDHAAVSGLSQATTEQQRELLRRKLAGEP